MSEVKKGTNKTDGVAKERHEDFQDKIKLYSKEYLGRVVSMGAEVSFPIKKDQYTRPKYWEEIKVNEGEDPRVWRKILTEWVIYNGSCHAEDVNDKHRVIGK